MNPVVERELKQQRTPKPADRRKAHIHGRHGEALCVCASSRLDRKKHPGPTGYRYADMIKIRPIRSMCFALVAFVLLAAGSVHAQGAEFALHGGRALDEYRNGLGGGAYLNIPTGIRTIHVGARGTYHIPTKTDEGEISLLMYGVDVGVTLLSSPLVVRAVGGLGRAQASYEQVIVEGDVRTDITRTTNTYYMQPGVLVGVSLGLAFVGIEGRYVRLDKGIRTYAAYATVGFKVGR